MSNDEALALRQAFGQFVTGVTVVTTCGIDRQPIGITANSFGSVSLRPPMVLWSLAHSAMSRTAFESAGYFCVHVLAASQRGVSERFSRSGSNKFGEVDWSWGPNSLPVLTEYLAKFHCRTDSLFQVGDHTVIIGEVLQYDRRGGRPLVFHGGQYAMSERRVIEAFERQCDGERTGIADRRKKR